MPEDYDFIPGKSVEIFDGTDYAVCATGSIMEEAAEAVERLREEGKKIKFINVHTLKPLDQKDLSSKLKGVKKVITVEEHNILGGLGGILAEIIVEEKLKTELIRIGLNDCFAQGYGTQKEVRAAIALLKRKMNGETEIDDVSVPAQLLRCPDDPALFTMD